MAIITTQDNGVTIVAFDVEEGYQDDLSWELRAEIRKLLKSKTHKIIINMDRLFRVNSQVLSVIIFAWEKTKAGGGNLVLCNLSEMARELLQVTQLQNHLQICSDLEEAKNLFAQ